MLNANQGGTCVLKMQFFFLNKNKTGRGKKKKQKANTGKCIDKSWQDKEEWFQTKRDLDRI